MSKDLFFNIWYDDMGSGWFLFVIVLSLLCLAILIFIFARIKAQNKSFSKKHIIYLGLFALIFYQIVPVTIDFYTTKISTFNLKKAIKLEQIAIKTSIIPWQKGGYYCKLATLHLMNKDYKAMLSTQKHAYNLVKSYKCPCWGISFLSFYIMSDYDTAIEIAQNSTKKLSPYQFISYCYIMKGNLEKAELYIDKAIQQKESFSNTATKAYILKVNGKTKESLVYYEKARQLCKNEKDKITVERIYKNFVEFEKERCSKIRKQQGI